MCPDIPSGPRVSPTAATTTPSSGREEVWREDVRLMREAGVNLVSLGIFTWALLEPARGRVRLRLAGPDPRPAARGRHRGRPGHPDRRAARLVRAAHPDAPPGRPGGPRARRRRAGRASAPAPRTTARPPRPDRRASSPSATRGHPAVVDVARAQRVRRRRRAVLLRDRRPRRSGTGCATATGTWTRSTRPGAPRSGASATAHWEEIEPPRLAPTAVNPAQQLDFARFCVDAHLGLLPPRARHHPAAHRDLPVTTNFMIANCKSDGLLAVGRARSTSSPTTTTSTPSRPDNHIELAMAADLTRSVAGGGPWLLMEHSTGAVNWQPRNLAKRPGEMRRNSLAHVARGSDAVLFFQWRASRYGAEKFHSAMLPHAGTGSRHLARGGRARRRPAPARPRCGAAGSRPTSAIVWDWESWWALELEWRPSVDLTFRERVDAFYEALWREHVTVDFVHPAADLSAIQAGRRAELVPARPRPPPRTCTATSRRAGTCWCRTSPASSTRTTPSTRRLPRRAARGARPVGRGVPAAARARDGRAHRHGRPGRIWSERVAWRARRPCSDFTDGPDAGHPAVTRHDLGAGAAWYVATAPRRPACASCCREVLDRAGVPRPRDLPDTLELVRRGRHVFLINHGDEPVTVDGRDRHRSARRRAPRRLGHRRGRRRLGHPGRSPVTVDPTGAAP